MLSAMQARQQELSGSRPQMHHLHTCLCTHRSLQLQSLAAFWHQASCSHTAAVIQCTTRCWHDCFICCLMSCSCWMLLGWQSVCYLPSLYAHMFCFKIVSLKCMLVGMNLSACCVTRRAHFPVRLLLHQAISLKHVSCRFKLHLNGEVCIGRKSYWLSQRHSGCKRKRAP